MQGKPKEKLVSVRQVMLKDIQQFLIHVIEIHEDIRLVFVSSKGFHNVAFADASGTFEQQSSFALFFVFPFQQFLIDFSSHDFQQFAPFQGISMTVLYTFSRDKFIRSIHLFKG